jgi:hypothetical protein
MCMIIDMNVAHKVFLRDDDPDFKAVHDSLFNDRNIRASVVYGGELLREYNRNNAVRRVVAALDRAARARKINDDSVDAEAKRLSESGACASDDPHIVALARISHVRLLCSHDRDLHRDFTNKSLLDNPRGKVYQLTAHKGLIKEFCG